MAKIWDLVSVVDPQAGTIAPFDSSKFGNILLVEYILGWPWLVVLKEAYVCLECR